MPGPCRGPGRDGAGKHLTGPFQEDRPAPQDTYHRWLTALRAPGIRAASLIDEASANGDHLQGLFAADNPAHRALKPATRQYLLNPDQDRLEADLEWLEAPDHHLICWGDERYPPLLRDINGPPAALWVLGEPDLLWQPQIAIVGSRNPTAGGLDHAASFGRHLARQGLTLTSGLALGVDSAAHRAALETGGHTVAVVATGLDRVYPARNRELAAEIAGKGALVSELPLGSEPLRSHFPARNRIISGLSLGTLVVEAGLKSGSLITARLASEQGREIFAIPGSIHNPMARGCHRLIRDGAKLVETADHILEELGPMADELAGALRRELGTQDIAKPEAAPDMEEAGMDPEYQRLFEAMGFEPRSIDNLVSATGLPPAAVSSMLLIMELDGQVEAHTGGRYSRRGPTPQDNSPAD